MKREISNKSSYPKPSESCIIDLECISTDTSIDSNDGNSLGLDRVFEVITGIILLIVSSLVIITCIAVIWFCNSRLKIKLNQKKIYEKVPMDTDIEKEEFEQKL